MTFKKPTLIPLLFIICSTLLLGGLGVWQVMRLEWKNNLNQQIADAQAMNAFGSLPESMDGLVYRNVVLTGKFLHDKTMRLAGGVQGESYGFFMVTPLVLQDDGRVILVNRGFAPKDADLHTDGAQIATGILRPAREKRLFTPENDIKDNIWIYEDLAAMEAFTGEKLLPLIVEATGKREPGVYPIPRSESIQLRNDHLSYAITWFSLMIVGLVMFGFYHRKECHPEQREGSRPTAGDSSASPQNDKISQ